MHEKNKILKFVLPNCLLFIFFLRPFIIYLKLCEIQKCCNRICIIPFHNHVQFIKFSLIKLHPCYKLKSVTVTNVARGGVFKIA